MTRSKNAKASLFVGRWQPFHKGHKTLIETVLKKGKPVVIGIRDVAVDQKNPYSLGERWTMIQESLKKYGSLVKIIAIPDIDEVCYGRDVGYAIRRIDLNERVQKISGTKVREKIYSTKPILWLTGQTGAGKTTLAAALRRKFGGVILDGDEMRSSVSLGLGLSPEAREEHNLRVARLAHILSRDNLVIVSVIAPFARVRAEIDKITQPTWIYIERNLKIDKNHPYEIPKDYHFKVNSDQQSTEEQVGAIAAATKKGLFEIS